MAPLSDEDAARCEWAWEWYAWMTAQQMHYFERRVPRDLGLAALFLSGALANLGLGFWQGAWWPISVQSAFWAVLFAAQLWVASMMLHYALLCRQFARLRRAEIRAIRESWGLPDVDREAPAQPPDMRIWPLR